jgi:hypothetical protein
MPPGRYLLDGSEIYLLMPIARSLADWQKPSVERLNVLNPKAFHSALLRRWDRQSFPKI